MRVLRRLVIGLTAITLGLSVHAGSATATTGQRIASGDGDAAGRCLDIVDGGVGMTVQMWECNRGRHQDWQYLRRPDIGQGPNVYQIKSRLDGRCLSALYGKNWGRPVTVESCSDGLLDHFWIMHGDPSGWHSWQNNWYRDQCMDVKDYGTSRTVQIWDCLMHQGNQRWKLF
jgi:hypothetical protein